MTVQRLVDLGEVFAGLNVTRVNQMAGAKPARLISLKDVVDEIAPLRRLGVLHADEMEVRRFRVSIGDVVVTARGATIRAVVVAASHENAVAGANLAIVRLRPDGLHPALLAAFLRDRRTRATLLRDTIGASTPGFTIRALSDLAIQVPSGERQQELAAIVEAADAHRAAMMRAVELRQQACLQVVASRLQPSARA